jgi:spore coat polysaccharide biosynthesis protein SpsF
MSKEFSTEQEKFWAGEFGDEYIGRNEGEALIGSNIALFSKILARCPDASSLIEFGSNIGLNLRAIRALRPRMELDAIEINEKAVRQLETWGGTRQVHHGSILEFRPQRTWDIALIKGVLIHMAPRSLQQVYATLFAASARYIVVIEYYNPTPVEVTYRGHSARLFKRDFAGEMLDRHPQLRIVDYGFSWRRDPVFPQDDTTWFLLEKRPK